MGYTGHRRFFSLLFYLVFLKFKDAFSADRSVLKASVSVEGTYEQGRSLP
ncbi:hypothetical protein JNUCC1_00858 [Lentibacillus sp. JNUCC-1]|nr:hypothetical protein [Lentibacillus sp. JNUCC-1]